MLHNQLLKFLGLPLLMSAAVLPAYAYDAWVEMTPGVPVEYTDAWSPFGGTFTLENDATVEFTINSNNSFGMEDGFGLYANQDLDPVLLNTNSEEGAGTYVLSAGTYYCYCMSVWGPGSIMISLQENGVQLNINEVRPAPGTTFSPSVNDGFVDLECDFNIFATSWQLKSDLYTSEVHYFDQEQQGTMRFLSVYVKDEINSLFSKGLTEGDDFQIVINGIQDPAENVYGEDGTLTINYKVGTPALDLLSSSLDANNPNKLLSYYLAGDDSALISFTFNQPFDTEAEQVVMPYINGNESTKTVYGPVLELGCTSTSSAQKLYYSGVYSDDNHTVTFDISGFDFGSWGGALGADGAQPVIKVYNLIDSKGEKALGSSASNPGSYSFQTDYQQYQPASFETEWTPGAGSELAETTAVKVTTIPSDNTGVYNRVRGFDSVRFHALSGKTASVPFADCDFEYIDEANGVFQVSCKTPEEIMGYTNVTVSLYKLTTCDNKYYASEAIAADFNPYLADTEGVITFKTASASLVESDLDIITTLATVRVFTDLGYDNSLLPTFTCSDPNVTREVYFVNNNPVTGDPEGDYYDIPIGQPIGLTNDGGAQTVADGTTFTITFPAKAFYDKNDGTLYKAVSHTWKFSAQQDDPSGIDELLPDENGYVVYSAAGLYVGKMASREALRNLPAGLYIVNGKKIFVK